MNATEACALSKQRLYDYNKIITKITTHAEYGWEELHFSDDKDYNQYGGDFVIFNPYVDSTLKVLDRLRSEGYEVTITEDPITLKKFNLITKVCKGGFLYMRVIKYEAREYYNQESILRKVIIKWRRNE